MTHGLFAYEATLQRPAHRRADRPVHRGMGHSAWNPASAGFDCRGSRSAEAGLPVRRRRLRHRGPPRGHRADRPRRARLAAARRPPGRTLLLGRARNRGGASYFEAVSTSLNRGWAPLTGVLFGREKYIELPLPELYDLSKDREEVDNLVDRKPDRRRVLEARLDQFGAAAPGERAAEDAESRARLQALGYVTGSAPRKDALHRGRRPEASRRPGPAALARDRAVRAQAALGGRPDLPPGHRTSARRWRSPTRSWRCCSGRWDGRPTRSPRSARRSRAGAAAVNVLHEAGHLPGRERPREGGDPAAAQVTAGRRRPTSTRSTPSASRWGGPARRGSASATFERILASRSVQHDGAREPRLDRADRGPLGRGAEGSSPGRSRPTRLRRRRTTALASSK